MKHKKRENKYRTSDGEMIEKSIIDRKVRESKALLLKLQVEQHGYNFCTICKRNDCIPVTCMHLESVDSCQKNGYAEKAWAITNMVPAGLSCHAKYDGNYLHNAKIVNNEN